LAVGLINGSTKLWDLDNGQILTFQGDPGNVSVLIFSADGRRVAVAGFRGRVRVWDATSGQEVWSPGERPVSRTVALSPDGSRLAYTPDNHPKVIKVWDLDRRRDILTLKGHTADVGKVDFTPDGKRLISAGGDAVRFWAVDSGQEVLTLKRGLGANWSFSPDGNRLASISGGTITIWDASKSMKEAEEQ
jgi:WD40 repeat protein